MENTVYDPTTASSSPARSWITPCRAPTTCRRLRDAMHNVPATTNPLGVKGVGEAGTTAAIAAVMNAVADAIPNGAGAHLDMPATAPTLGKPASAPRAEARSIDVRAHSRGSGIQFDFLGPRCAGTRDDCRSPRRNLIHNGATSPPAALFRAQRRPAVCVESTRCLNMVMKALRWLGFNGARMMPLRRRTAGSMLPAAAAGGPMVSDFVRRSSGRCAA